MGDFGDNNLNQGLYTMMSYNDGFATNPAGALDPGTTPGFGWEGTPMAFDIAALQYLYGANTTTRAGNTTYTLPTANAAGSFYSSIWDAGGIDTIVTAGNANTVIDLRAATLLNANGGGGFLSKVNGINGGFTIAAGAVIENATGGGGADSITGNTASNVLTGNGGVDFLNGGDGNDTLNGGLGNVQCTGGAGTDTVNWSSATGAIVFTLGATGNGVTANVAGIGVDTLSGIENLIGGAAADTLTGNASANLLGGGLGADQLNGLAGNDIYVVDNVGDAVNETLNAGTDTVQTTLAAYTLGANVEWLAYTGTGNFTGKGNALSNKISGGAGSDYITMDGAGNDAVNGFEGFIDTIDFRLLGGAVVNFVTNVNAGSAAGDSFLNIERVFGSNTAADDVTGGNREAVYSGFGGNDILRGGSKADTLNGNDGNDTITGNGSVDTIEGGRDNDSLTGNASGDFFVFRETFASGGIGQDVVTDFTDGVDKLKFGAATANALADFTITGQGTTTVVMTVIGGSADTITLQSAAAITIGATDVLFF